MLKRLKWLFAGRPRPPSPPAEGAAAAPDSRPGAPAPPAAAGSNAAEPDVPSPRPDAETAGGGGRIRHADIDPEAAKVVRRLARHDHVSYLVGGCVRDLLLGRRPKDFDVSTSATPVEVRRLFRNSRIIGRRFQLVHVFFRNPGGGGPERIIEVSTFRAYHGGNEDSEDLLIKRDNVFGSVEQDALRRDFTINALFYDPAKKALLDHVGGLEDLQRRVLRTIGDPDIRFREDPIRILRAIKFASRLGFRIDDATLEAMRLHRGDIQRCAAPRILEELLRILRSGASSAAFALMGETRTLEVLLPEIDGALGREPALVETYRHILGQFDDAVSRGDELTTPVLMASLLLPLIPWPEPASAAPGKGAQAAMMDLLDGVLQRLRVSRRDSDTVRQLLLSIRKMVPGYRARRFSRSALALRPYFADLLDVFSIHCRATGRWLETLPAWEECRPRDRPAAGKPRRARAGRSSRDDPDRRRSGPGDGRPRRRRRGGRGRRPGGSRPSPTTKT